MGVALCPGQKTSLMELFVISGISFSMYTRSHSGEKMTISSALSSNRPLTRSSSPCSLIVTLCATRPRVKKMSLPDSAGFTYARIPCRRAYGGCFAIHFLNKRDLGHLRRERFLRPELLRDDGIKKKYDYPYVHGDVKPLELTRGC